MKNLSNDIFNSLSTLLKPSDIHILVVDDDEHVLEFFKDFLEDMDFKVTTAASGEEAIGMIYKQEVDIAIVDYKLPGIDGLTTIQKIIDNSHATVTMIMTGFPTLDSSIRAIKLGASDYILKPFKMDEILKSLKKGIHEREIRLETKKLKERLSILENNLSKTATNISINSALNTIGNIHNKGT